MQRREIKKMKAIETIMDVKDNGEFVLHFPREVKPGRNGEV
jgi:hypothetical protein